MKEIYEISKVKTVVTYTRYSLTDEGKKILDHVQTLSHEGLLTKEDLVTEAQSRCLPEYNIEVVVDDNLKN